MCLSLKYAFKKNKFDPDVWYFENNFYFLFHIYCSRFSLLVGKVDWFVLCRKEGMVDAYQDIRNAGKVFRVGRGVLALGVPWWLYEATGKTSIQNSFSFFHSWHIPVSHFLVAPSFCSSVCYLYTAILKLNNLYHSLVNYVRWDSNSISINHVESALCISNAANTFLVQVDS